MSKTIPDATVNIYLNWVLTAHVVSNINVMKGNDSKYLLELLLIKPLLL